VLLAAVYASIASMLGMSRGWLAAASDPERGL